MRLLAAFFLAVVLFHITEEGNEVENVKKSKGISKSFNNVKSNRKPLKKRTKSNKKRKYKRKIRNSRKTAEKKRNVRRRKENKRMKKNSRKKKGKKRNMFHKEGEKKLRNGKRKIDITQKNISCTSLECLNDLVAVLKINKDQAENFLKQNKRIRRLMNLAGNLFY